MSDAKLRRDQVLEYIVTYADENSGITPSTRQIAKALGVSQSRVNYLMQLLIGRRFIEFVDREKYKVVDSVWEKPPYL